MYFLYWSWTDVQAAEIAAAHELVPVSNTLRGILRSALRSIICNETVSSGGGASKFKTFLLAHVEYALTPTIIGAGATFP
jgi:hypothetical protein